MIKKNLKLINLMYNVVNDLLYALLLTKIFYFNCKYNKQNGRQF